MKTQSVVLHKVTTRQTDKQTDKRPPPAEVNSPLIGIKILGLSVGLQIIKLLEQNTVKVYLYVLSEISVRL